MFCSYCGDSIQVVGNFCGKCGKQLHVNVATSLSNAHDVGDISRIEFGAIRKRLKLSNWDFLSSEALEENPLTYFQSSLPGPTLALRLMLL